MIDFSFKMTDFSFKMVDFSFKMVDFSFKMADFSCKMAGFSFKMVGFSFKMAFCSFRLARGGRARGGLSPLRFRVLPFLSRKVLWTHSLCERGSTPPIGAKPCSCTCRAGPRGLNRPLS